MTRDDIRTDLVDAHRHMVASLGRAGAWWTAVERRAIGAAVRHARSFEARAPWESPRGLGVDVDGSELPEAALDVVWRLTNHPGTLTADWYETIIASLPWDRHEAERRYVELVAIVAALNAVDRFADALGVERIELPESDASSPTIDDLVDAAVDLHWVPTAATSGANVFRSLTAVPSAAQLIVGLSDVQYVPQNAVVHDLSWDRNTLNRSQIELLAALTSMSNECFY